MNIKYKHQHNSCQTIIALLRQFQSVNLITFITAKCGEKTTTTDGTVMRTCCRRKQTQQGL